MLNISMHTTRFLPTLVTNIHFFITKVSLARRFTINRFTCQYMTFIIDHPRLSKFSCFFGLTLHSQTTLTVWQRSISGRHKNIFTRVIFRLFLYNSINKKLNFLTYFNQNSRYQIPVLSLSESSLLHVKETRAR
jgi:hypothetical protein